jgi:ABC-2 type transport system ATP-binding protein
MTAIEVRGLRKSYRNRCAVDGLDLTIDDGEVFALLGPNGAGKTTTVEILEGHRRRDGGEVRVLGEDPGRAGRRWRSRLGIVPQSAGDAADLTVAETVRHFAGYYPAPRDPAHTLDVVGLADRAGARVRTLSGGERRRLDVALGIIGDPDLLFLDEPTTGFDPEARRRFWTLIQRLADEGTTILLTTHYLDEAEALADRLAVLVDGRIAAQGSPETLGGRATDPATVTWTDVDGAHEARTGDPAGLVAHLAVAADRAVRDLCVHRPSLEDIYLRLIGAQS